ncbi:MAG: hypothetical protein P8129_10970 [Anaerolineae bacterium]
MDNGHLLSYTDAMLLFITPTISEYRSVEQALDTASARNMARLALCGMGSLRAEAFARDLAQGPPVAGLVLLGWAGGLETGLAVGDVVVAEAARDEEGAVVPCSPIDLPGARRGTLLTVRRVLLSAAAKQAAWANGALAVEMEAYPLAAWAAAQGLPFVHARVILDAADEDLPSLATALDAFGRVRPLPLLGELLARPRLVPHLWLMARRLGRLRPILGALAAAVLEAWPPGAPA